MAILLSQHYLGPRWFIPHSVHHSIRAHIHTHTHSLSFSRMHLAFLSLQWLPAKYSYFRKAPWVDEAGEAPDCVICQHTVDDPDGANEEPASAEQISAEFAAAAARNQQQQQRRRDNRQPQQQQPEVDDDDDDFRDLEAGGPGEDAVPLLPINASARERGMLFIITLLLLLPKIEELDFQRHHHRRWHLNLVALIQRCSVGDWIRFRHARSWSHRAIMCSTRIVWRDGCR